MTSFSRMSCLVLLGTTLGCSPDDGLRFKARFGYLPKSAEGACPSQKVGKPDYSKEIDAYRVQVFGDDMETIQQQFAAEDLATKGKLEVTQVPIGERDVVVAGLQKKATRWRGIHQRVKVESGQTAEVGVLLTKLSAMTCTRTPLVTARVFASSTLLQDGRVLLAGGFFETTADTGTCPTCRTYSATPSAEIFDPHKGTFTAVEDMHKSRGLHRAALLGNGKVLLVGGARVLKYQPGAGLIPLRTEEHRLSVELFDPQQEKFFEISGDDVARVFHTVTSLADGRVLATGGGVEVSRDGATNSSMLCQSNGASVDCGQGPEMASKRIGHTATVLLDGRVFVWGGATHGGSTDSCSEGGKRCPEWFLPDHNRFVAVDDTNKVSGSGAENNLFFSTAVSVQGYGVLLTGGLSRTDGELDDRLILSSQPVDLTYIYIPGRAEMGHRLSDGDALRLPQPAIFMEGANLARDGRSLLAGGYSGLDLTPIPMVAIFDIVQLNFVANLGVELRQPRGGASVVHLGGGAVLVAGGESTDGTGAALIADTAEIYTDELDPSF